MGMNDENLHGLMMADSPSTLNSQQAIEQRGNQTAKLWIAACADLTND